MQAAVYRATLDKTFQFHGKWDAVRQRNESPVAVSAVVSIEGGDNFTERRAPAVGAIVSRSLAERAAIYAAPITNTLSTTYGQVARGGSPNTLYLGFNLARKFF